MSRMLLSTICLGLAYVAEASAEPVLYWDQEPVATIDLMGESVRFERFSERRPAEPGWPVLAGSFGIRSLTEQGAAVGPMETRLGLLLEPETDGLGPTFQYSDGPWSLPLRMEEIDERQFDFSNAIVFLKHRGRVPGWFFYEARVRVRPTGLKSVTGRVWVRW